jgi:membrane associated rhomboid family serine protease
VQSETHFLAKFVLHLFSLPYVLIMILLKKKEWGELFTPFGAFIDYFFEPTCTVTLVFLNCVLFIVSAFMPEKLFESLLLHPTDLLHPNRWYALVTNTFLHTNTAHLLGNMLLLYAAGRVVEKKVGSAKVLLVYCVALLGASVSAALFYLMTNPAVSVLGASGAIMGMAAAAMFLDPFYIVYEFIIPLPMFAVGWIAIYADFSSVFTGQQDGIAHFAHIGGFASIIIIYLLVREADKRTLKKGLLWNIAMLIAAAIVFFAASQYL